MSRLLALAGLLALGACQSPGAEGAASSGDRERRAAAWSPAEPAGPVEAQAHRDREELRRRDLRIIGRRPPDEDPDR